MSKECRKRLMLNVNVDTSTKAYSMIVLSNAPSVEKSSFLWIERENDNAV